MNNLTNLSNPNSNKLELALLLREKQRRIQESPLKYAKEHKKQTEATKNPKHLRALFWGNRVGKTEWGAQEVARYALGKHPFKNIAAPVEIWCACPSFELQEETTQKKLLRYIPESEIAHRDKLRGEILRSLKLKNGSVVTFKSYEQGREKFQGVGKRLIWFDEEPPYDIYEECSVREEAGEELDIIMTMTPINGMTWVYDLIYSATDNPDIFISEAEWDDNPWLTDKQKERMMRGKTYEQIEVRRKGKFIKRVGLVCGWWGRTVHIKNYTTLDKSWTWFRVGDGGYSDPFAYLLIGIDHQGDINVVRGFREPGLLTQEIKRRISTLETGLVVNKGVADNDNPRLLEELQKTSDDDPISIQFSPIEKKQNENASWDEFLAESLAKYGQIQKGTGKPRLYISDALVRYDDDKGVSYNWLQQEIENLVWEEVKSREGSEIRPKWDTHRRFKHHFDGIRALAYFIADYDQPKDSRKTGEVVKSNNSMQRKWSI